MMLSDRALAEAIAAGDVEIEPYAGPANIRPVGIRLHLADKLLIPMASSDVIDLANGMVPEYETVSLNPHGYILNPKTFVLGSTLESVRVAADLVCHLDGRSTLARLGLMIHCTAAVIDNNNDGPRTIVLELYNFGPNYLRLRSRLPIGMLAVSRLTSPIIQENASQYAGQSGVVAPDLDFHASGRHLTEGYRQPE